jgi:hypothetical protein
MSMSIVGPSSPLLALVIAAASLAGCGRLVPGAAATAPAAAAPAPAPAPVVPASTVGAQKTYICPMCPGVESHDPDAKCPHCHMDLVEKAS